ncbi:uncharacterized protein [Procambarus clarkii]|uniref:uncharacterized protein isoform X2 n=1 Tax=Procambarus clarkii TaxID=6728 RepID=UPI001E677FCE|nr:uncharacterized protein LOC123754031 [Procambarus clarkii]
MQHLIRFRDVGQPVYLNISSLSPGPTHHSLPDQLRDQHLVQSSSHHDTAIEGKEFNFTYEMRQLGSHEPAVEGLDYAHLQDCHYNGVPVLHQLSDRKFRFTCECAAGASGASCQLGGLCSSDNLRSWCSDHGECRYVAGESICVCEGGYRGASCEHHFTTIPSYDRTCGGLLQCHQSCHLRVEAQANLTFCSCTAGYVPTNATHCVTQEYWDVTVRMKIPDGRLYSEGDVLNKTLMVVTAGGGGVVDARNLSITTRAGEVEVEVTVEGTEVAARLTSSDLWQRQFGPVKVEAARTPPLSLGPVTAEWEEGSVLVLTCPVYGGPLLAVSWFKDGSLVYSHAVPYCSLQERTRRVQLLAKPGAADHECSIMLIVTHALREDLGTYVCQVADRGYLASQVVMAGRNQSLQLDIFPRVRTVFQGEAAKFECSTRNRRWADPRHYTAHWLLHPAHAHTNITPIHRTGSSLTIFNLTQSLNVTCIMTEEKGLMWTPVDEDGEVASTVAVVHVLAPGALACHDDLAYGVSWRLTPAEERYVAPCPDDYGGTAATRPCLLLQRPDVPPDGGSLTTPNSSEFSGLQPSWDLPDFSECLYRPLEYITRPLYYYKRGFSSLPEDLESLAKDVLKILQERVSPVLPGEGASILNILEMFEASDRLISLSVFLSILQTVVRQKNALSFAASWRMLEVTRKHMRAIVASSLSEREVKTEEVNLPDLTAKVACLGRQQLITTLDTQHISFKQEGEKISLVRVLVKAVPEGRPRPGKLISQEVHQEVMEGEKLWSKRGPQRLQYLQGEKISAEWEGLKKVQQQQQQQKQQEQEEQQQEQQLKQQEQEEQQQEQQLKQQEQEEQQLKQQSEASVGILAFLHSNNFPATSPHHMFRDGRREVVTVAAPLVMVVEHHDDVSTVRAGASGAAETAHTTLTNFSIVSRLIYSCPESSLQIEKEKGWMAACGLARVDEGAIHWDLTLCSLLKAEAGGTHHHSSDTATRRCECQCRGQGLFTLLLVRATTPEVLQEDSAGPRRKERLSVAVSCVLSAAATVVCALLLVPRAALTTVQLRLLKCLALTALNLTFAVFSVWPTSQVVHEGVLVTGSSCLVLCVGVGGSQQMALHQQLAITTHTTPISPTHTTTIVVLVGSCLMGLGVWGVQRLCRYQLGDPWLPLGDARGLTAAVLGFLVAVTLLLAALTGHNLRKIAVIKAATRDHRSVALICERVWQLAMVVVGEWLVITTSLVQHHHLGRHFFCLATLAQGALVLVTNTCTNDDVIGMVWCRRGSLACDPPPQEEEGVLSTVGVQQNGCMEGLVACRISSLRKYESIPEREYSHLKDDVSEFRTRGGSFWSQTTTTMMLPESEIVHSPTDPLGPFSHRLMEPRIHLHRILEPKTLLPLYARGSSTGTAGDNRPRNLFLRGSSLVSGEDTSSPQDILSVSSLVYEAMDARMLEQKRNMSFNVHHPVIHELPQNQRLVNSSKQLALHQRLDRIPSRNYLNMSLSKHRNCSKGENMQSTKDTKETDARRYMNIENGDPGSCHVTVSKTAACYANTEITNTCQGGSEQSNFNHSYLPMAGKGKRQNIQTHCLRRINDNSTLHRQRIKALGDTHMVTDEQRTCSAEQSQSPITEFYPQSPDTLIYSQTLDTSIYSQMLDTSIYSQTLDTSIYTQTPDTSIYSQTLDTSIYSQVPDTSIYTQTLDTSIYTQTLDTSIYSQTPDTSIYSQTLDTSIYAQQQASAIQKCNDNPASLEADSGHSPDEHIYSYLEIPEANSNTSPSVIRSSPSPSQCSPSASQCSPSASHCFCANAVFDLNIHISDFPGGEASVGEASVGEASGGEASGGEASVGEASGGEASVGEASVGEASGGEASGGEASGGEASVGEASGGEASGGEESGDETSGGEASGGEASVGEASGGEASGGEASVGEASGGEASGGEESGDETSGGEASVGEASVGEASVGEASGGEASGGEASGVASLLYLRRT